jgi:hypothetical protein
MPAWLRSSKKTPPPGPLPEAERGRKKAVVPSGLRGGGPGGGVPSPLLCQRVLPLGAAAGLLAGFLLLGRQASADLRDADRHYISFSDLECSPPPGLTREGFLREVQYEAEQPDRLGLLDPDLAGRLQRAFSRHAWVEQVERVEIGSGNRARVRVRFRTPVLGIETAGELRAVDGEGVLLPRAAGAAGLPVFRGERPGPEGPTGTVWPDARVRDAARTAGFLADVWVQLGLESVGAKGDGLVLGTRNHSRVVWGRPPGGEKPDEAPAGLKRDRLLEFLRRQAEEGGTALAYEHDVRPTEAARHRPLKDVAVTTAREEP